MTEETRVSAVTAGALPEPVAAGRSGRRAALGNYLALVRVLSRKNFQVRYKRASLGVIWAVVQPAFQAALLSFVFLKIFQISTLPNYPLYVLSGILIWSFFGSSLQGATSAIVDNGPLVRKVAVPLSVFPVAAVGGTAIAFSASLLVLLALTAAFGELGVRILLLPVAVLLAVGLTIGLGLLTCAFHVAFRDVKYFIESALLAGLYATPILYELDRVPGAVRPFIEANPMTGVMVLTRTAVMGRPFDVSAVVVSVVVVTLLLVMGSWVFSRRAREFADLV